MQQKNMMIFGDSYSTYNGYIPEGYAIYYPHLDVDDVEQTWWKQLSHALGAQVVLNDSWSGSTVCNTGYEGDCSKTSSFLHRLELLTENGFFAEHTLDHIFVFGGTNDSWSGNDAGEVQYENRTEEDLYRILPGFACFIDRLLRVADKKAVHVIVNSELRREVTDGIIEICRHYDVAHTVLAEIDKEAGHPTVRGMTQIKEQILATIANETSAVAPPENKQIVFTAPCRAELLPVAMPTPGAHDVVVKLAVSSVSGGTERANLVGDVNISIAPIDPDAVAVFPRYTGYSSAGVVTAIGDAVTSVKVGDRVALSWSLHKVYNCVPEAQVYKLDDNVSFAAGALIHISTFPMAAVRKTKLEVGESAIVMGCGVLGLIAVRLLCASGAVPVIAADPDPARREMAIKMGADIALDPFAPDFVADVKRYTNGGAKVAIEVTGNGKALDTVLDCMAEFGRIALLGCTRNPNFTIDYYRKIHGRGITLVGAHTLARPKYESSDGWWTLRDDAAAVIALMKYGRFRLDDMVEATYKPEEAPAVYTRLANEASFPITQFNWEHLA